MKTNFLSSWLIIYEPSKMVQSISGFSVSLTL